MTHKDHFGGRIGISDRPFMRKGKVVELSGIEPLTS